MTQCVARTEKGKHCELKGNMYHNGLCLKHWNMQQAGRKIITYVPIHIHPKRKWEVYQRFCHNPECHEILVVQAKHGRQYCPKCKGLRK